MSRAVKLTARACVAAKLPPARRIVAMVIAAHADRDGEAWPGFRTIAQTPGST